MKKLKLFLSVFMMAAMFGGMAVVSAATGTITNTTTNHAITLSRSVTGVTNKVSNTFNYSVTADSNNPATATGIPTGGTVVFSGVTPTSGTATATGTIEFSGAEFTKNGDYSYVIKETSSTDSTTYPVDTANKYTIKVSVRNASETDFTNDKVVSVTVYKGEGASATKQNSSTITFTSASVTRTITIAKTVKGTMADADEYFGIKVNVGGATGATYAVTGQTKSGAPTSITAGTDATLYLKHGETATISGVVNGTTYSFQELNATDYTTKINGTVASDKKSGSKTVGATNSNTIENEWNRDVLTGVVLKYIPYIVIIGLAIAAIIVVAVRNKKQKEATEIE